MRNRYPGVCYRCNAPVAVGEGHFERFGSTWRTQHANCAIEFRGTGDPARDALNVSKDAYLATMTGKRGNRARKRVAERLNERFAELGDSE